MDRLPSDPVATLAQTDDRLSLFFYLVSPAILVAGILVGAWLIRNEDVLSYIALLCVVIVTPILAGASLLTALLLEAAANRARRRERGW